MSQSKLNPNLCLCPILILVCSLIFTTTAQSRKDNSLNNSNNNNIIRERAGRGDRDSNNNNNNNSFKPSKGLQDLNGNSINNSNAVNNRYFQHNLNPYYYTPTPYSKFNHFFYPSPSTLQQPSPTLPSFYPGQTSLNNFGHGHYQRQIRVPGIIEIRLQGRDAEITCEFQRYIILIQVRLFSF